VEKNAVSKAYNWCHHENALTVELVPTKMQNAKCKMQNTNAHAGGMASKVSSMKNLDQFQLRKNGAEQSDIAKIEQYSVLEISKDLQQVFLSFDGAKFPPNLYDIGTQDNNRITGFVPASKVLSEMKANPEIPGNFIPFAWPDGGGLLLFDLKSKAVFEYSPRTGWTIDHVADNLHTFFDSIYRFEPDDIPELEAEVIWLDPDFKPEFD
jgi:hypothetical protein